MCTLKFATHARSYEENLQTLLALIAAAPEDAIVLAPEVCLSGFDYANLEAAASFAAQADKALRARCERRIIVLTMIVRQAGDFLNVARVYSESALRHEQAKSKLFRLGEEHRWFAPGSGQDVTVFEIDGIRMGLLVCFELRFTALWEQLRGAELIFIPAQWGRARAEHYDLLGRALAVANQCYVMQSDTADADTSGISGVVSPFGACERNGEDAVLTGAFDPAVVRKMRRYLDTGVR